MVGNNPPEFYNPPSCPFYNYQPTWSSPYGQQTVSHLTVGANGSFPPAALEANYYARWGPGSIAAKEGWYKDGAPCVLCVVWCEHVHFCRTLHPSVDQGVPEQ